MSPEPLVRICPGPDPLAHLPLRLDAGQPPSSTLAVEPLLLTAAQAAELCGLSLATWYRMASAGRCPAPVRLSRGCVRWRAEELRDWINAGCPDRRIWEAQRRAKGGGR
jgi:predicted DNA-binding transcriptional regulator AlpA